MDTYTSFDPMAWANDQQQPSQVITPQPAALLPGNDLEKARATVEELVRLGANIADSYFDWLECGCALAELGPEARDLYHQVSAQSSKYREADCEKKWQECLAKRDGRITIATFYKMAQQAGVDLSAIGRRFPSNPSTPHVEGTGQTSAPPTSQQTRTTTYNNNKIGNSSLTAYPVSSISPSSEGVEGSEGFGGNGSTTELPQYTETFSDKLDCGQLPVLIQDALSTQTTPEGRDKVILTSLTLWSGAMPGVRGLYDGKWVYPPFYTLIDAPSGADKGVIACCDQLVMPIEWEIRKKCEREQEDYQQELAQWNALTKKERGSKPQPKEPPYQSVFIPANSSATSAYQALADNGEWGIIFETEADTLAQALKQDYGDYSDGLRKAFHHERISYNRRKENEHVNVDHPRLAALLTCTPGQIPQLLSPQQVENGLANRFLFYNLKSNHHWRDVFATCDEPIADRLLKVGQRYLELYHDLADHAAKPLEFVLSEEQKSQFNNYFSSLLLEQIGLHGEQLDAFVKRLGLSTFRLCMTLTVLRCEEHKPRLDPLSQTLVCAERDFQTAMAIADCLINHTTHVYANLLPHDDQTVAKNGISLSASERQLFEALSSDFTTQEARQAAERLGIPWKTAERYIGQFVSKYHIATRIRNGQYHKP